MFVLWVVHLPVPLTSLPQVIPSPQARLAYLTQLGELISYGGRSYTATMMVG